MNCTLSLSGDKSLPRKLKEDPVSSSGSLSFELTKRSSPGLEKAPKGEKKESAENKKRKPSEASDENEEYAMDFEEYNENIEINERR